MGGPTCAPALPQTPKPVSFHHQALGVRLSLAAPWKGQPGQEGRLGVPDVQGSVGPFLCSGQAAQLEEGLTFGLASELGPDGDVHLEHGLSLDHELQPEGGGHLEVGGCRSEDGDVAWGDRGLRKEPTLGRLPSQALGAGQGLRTYESCMGAIWCFRRW